MKVIILDECDYITPNAQAALRNLMETFSKHCRFILTCNFVERIIDPIQSRCQTFQVIPPNKKDVAIHLSNILKQEGIESELTDIGLLVNSGYPDIRRVINGAQRQCIDGKLVIDKQSIVENDYKLKLLKILEDTVFYLTHVIYKIDLILPFSIKDDIIEEYKSLTKQQSKYFTFAGPQPVTLNHDNISLQNKFLKKQLGQYQRQIIKYQYQ